MIMLFLTIFIVNVLIYFLWSLNLLIKMHIYILILTITILNNKSNFIKIGIMLVAIILIFWLL